MSEPSGRATPRHALGHIPGEDGWPVVGRTFEVLADPKGFVEQMGRRYGPVYRTRALGDTNVGLLGPEANEFVLRDPGQDILLCARLERAARKAFSARADTA